ncbi:MAG TPA: hypothetical protein VIJ27_03255 [Mucilaginibacter sp.]
MALQYISDNSGNHTAVIIPITEWNNITATHEDLKELMEKKVSQTNNASRFKGLLTNEEAEKYHQYLKQARSEWERDI